MSVEDRALLTRAAELHRPLARAAKLGRANSTAYAVFGALSLFLVLVDFDAVGASLGAVLVGVGLFQHRECARLLRADAAAPRRLARAELILLGALVLYGVLGLILPPATSASLQQELRDARSLGIDLRSLTNSINETWYSTVIAVSLLYQGGMARYFQRRGKAVAAYLEAVPVWAREIVESMAR